MVIDIIDPSAEEYQNLSSLQYAMIRAAQAEKNEVVAKARKRKQTIFLKLLDAHVPRVSVYNNACIEIDAETDARVDVIREDLLHRLALESLYGDENGTYRYPENPNYNLGYPQRFLVVRDYYMHVTLDPQARLAAYGADSLARTYLGEYYETLYDLLASYC